MKFAILAPGKIAQSMAVAVNGIRAGKVQQVQQYAMDLGVDTDRKSVV